MSIKISKKLVCDAIMQLAQDEERWITIGAGPRQIPHNLLFGHTPITVNLTKNFKGRHVLIDSDTGEIKKGLSKSAIGQNIKDVFKNGTLEQGNNKKDSKKENKKDNKQDKKEETKTTNQETKEKEKKQEKQPIKTQTEQPQNTIKTDNPYNLSDERLEKSKAYEEKKQARVDRLQERADKKYQEFLDNSKKTMEELHKIPFGQPNIIGRRDIYADAHRYDNKAKKALHQSEYLQEKAENAQRSLNNGVIYMNDPASVEKYEQRIKDLEDIKEYEKETSKKLSEIKSLDDALNFDVSQLTKRDADDFNYWLNKAKEQQEKEKYIKENGGSHEIAKKIFSELPALKGVNYEFKMVKDPWGHGDELVAVIDKSTPESKREYINSQIANKNKEDNHFNGWDQYDGIHLYYAQADVNKAIQRLQGVVSYFPANTNAKIRDAKKKLEKAKQLRANSEKFAESGGVQSQKVTNSGLGDFELIKDFEGGRFRLKFNGIPDADVRNKLKAKGLRWSPREKTWNAYLTNNGKWTLTELFKENNINDIDLNILNVK